MKRGLPFLLPGDEDCINEKRVNAIALAALDKIIRVGWVGNRKNRTPVACALTTNRRAMAHTNTAYNSYCLLTGLVTCRADW